MRYKTGYKEQKRKELLDISGKIAKKMALLRLVSIRL